MTTKTATSRSKLNKCVLRHYFCKMVQLHVKRKKVPQNANFVKNLH